MRFIAAIVFSVALGAADMNLFARLKAAAGIIAKGGNWEGTMFNRVPPEDGGSGEKLNMPYAQSVWVSAAIKFVAGPIAAVPLKFGTGTDAKTAISNPDLSSWWRFPAIGAKTRTGAPRLLSFCDTITATVSWLGLKGEAFWIMDDSWRMPFPESRKLAQWPKLIIARPDRMRHVVVGDELIGWEFTDKGGKTAVLLPEQVIHIPSWNPYDDWRGLGPMSSAQVAAEADYLAGLYNRNLMRENGDRGPFVILKNGIPNDAQRQQVIAQLREKRARALRGEFRPAFLQGDMTIEDPKAQPMDMALVSQRLQNREEIFIAFGVPPSMSTKAASYSIGSASDYFRLIEMTCMPLAENIAEHIGMIARKMTGQNLEAWLDWDEHSVMQQVRAERIEVAEKLWSKGMPMEQISEYLRLSLPEFEGWDVGYLPYNLQVAGEVGLQPDPAVDPALAEPGAQDPVQDGIARIAQAFEGCKVHGNGALKADFQTRRDPGEVARWTHYVQARKPVVKAYENAWRRTMMEARKDTLARLEKLQLASPEPVGKAAVADIIFDQHEVNAKLLARMRRVSQDALDAAGQQVYDELSIDDPWKTPAADTLRFLGERENKIKGAAQDVFDSVRTQIEEGMNAGEPMQAIADRIRAVFNESSKARAKTIAITETAAAYGQGRHAAMQHAGVEWKEWLTSGNANVRPAHEEANGQRVRLNEPFMVGGEPLMHPGDPNGSAEMTVNCHCVQVAVEGPA